MYNQLQQKYQAALNTIKRKYNLISLFRLTVGFLFLINGFYAIKTGNNIHFYIGFLLILVFIVILRIHKKVDFQRRLTQNLLQINVTELEYLNQ